MANLSEEIVTCLIVTQMTQIMVPKIFKPRVLKNLFTYPYNIQYKMAGSGYFIYLFIYLFICLFIYLFRCMMIYPDDMLIYAERSQAFCFVISAMHQSLDHHKTTVSN